MSYDRQCSSCGGFCGRGGCKRENVKVSKRREALQRGETCERAKLCAVCAGGISKNEQKPVAWMCADEDMTRKGYSRFSRNCEGDWSIPVYTAPPARKPLTDEEIMKTAKETQSAEPGRDGYILPFAFARAIERAHGIGGTGQ